MTLDPTWEIAVDWNDDGDFGDTGEDITNRVLDRGRLTVTYGRDQARMLAPPRVGEAALELDNASGDYSPENGASPLAGNVLPGRPVRIRATSNAVTYTVFRGHLDDYDVLPDVGQQSVKLSCLDPLARLKGVQVSTGLHSGLTTGQAIGYVLDAAGWDADLRDLDPGATVVPYFWAANDDAYDLVGQLVDSEGPGSLLTVDGDGAIVFRSRHHRLLNAASTTSQATFRDTGSEPLHSAPLKYDHGWKEIVNTVVITTPVRAPAGELDVVWQQSGQLAVANGQTAVVHVEATSPFLGALTPVAGTDYTLLSGTVTVTMGRTSGQATTIYVTASGGTAVLTGLQLRAYPLETVSTARVEAEESTSIARYGRRSLSSLRQPVWASANDAIAIADLVLAQRAERLPVVTITLRGGNTTRLAQQLGRDLSDRVTIIEADTGLDGEFFIEQISHDADAALLTTTFACEMAPSVPADVLVLDDAALGLLGTGTLGGSGVSDPDTVFVLDTSELDTGLLGY